MFFDQLLALDIGSERSRLLPASCPGWVRSIRLILFCFWWMQDLQTFLKSFFIDRVCNVLSNIFFFSCPTSFSNPTWMLTHTELFFGWETTKTFTCASYILTYDEDRKPIVCSIVGLSQGHLVMFFLLAEEVMEKVCCRLSVVRLLPSDALISIMLHSQPENTFNCFTDLQSQAIFVGH